MKQLVGFGEFHRASRFNQAHRSAEVIVNRCTLEQSLFHTFSFSRLIISPLQDYRQVFYQEYTAKNRYQQLFVMMANTAIIPPIVRLPVSPINTCAG